MPSRVWTGKIAAAFLVSLLGVAALPSPYAGFSLEDVRRPLHRGNLRTRDLKSEGEVIVKSDISVVGAEDGRAVNVNPLTTPTPIGESLKMVTKQLLQAPSATDMVATDVRTPPRVKSQHKITEAVGTDFVPLGKGEALPVLMEDPSSYEIITAPPPLKQSTAVPGGISTWILLSNGEQSTTATNKKKPFVPPTADPKKGINKNSSISPTAEKFTKKEDGLIMKPVQNKPNHQIKKQNSTTEESTKPSTIILQDSKFKNRTPVVVGRIPAVQTNKTETKKVTTTQNTNLITTTAAPKRKPIIISPTAPTKYISEIVPTTSLVVETDPIGTTDESSTTESTTSTTKRTRRPSNKKKKKNKNRRRRPTKSDTDTAESKIQETNVAATKIEPNRPISTRIYNYLAREVMPSVGVGIVGLVLTAGLAGLFLYPFGGGIARRNYDKGHSTIPDQHMYYYNSYAPHPEPEQSNSQPEEKVFGQVLSSMSQTAYSPPFDSSKYTTSNNKFRYDMHDYGLGNVNGYAGNNDYSTLPDSVKNADYSPHDPMKTNDYSLHVNVKNSDSYSPIETPKNDYSLPDPIKNSDYLPEASKFYSMDPVSSHYKLTDSSPQVDKFPSLSEYTSYTNAASVGTVGDFATNNENKTEPPVGEDKSDKSQPQFSALVGSPQFTNTDFVGSVALTGSYGAQEVRHRTGALASEHGPRSLENKERSKRDVHDDFANEIDTTDDKILKNPPAPSVSSTQTSTTYDQTTVGTVSTNTASEQEDSTLKESVTTVSEENSQTTDSADTTTENFPSSTEESVKFGVSSTASPTDVTQGGGGFLGFLTRLAQLKLKLGISILRTTGEAFQRYLNTMAKRMEAAVRTMEKKRRSFQSWSQMHEKRERRDLAHQKRRFKQFKKQQ